MVMPNQEAAEGAGTEGGRRPSVVPAPSAANPEISDRPRRRTFTAPKKLRILKEVDEAAGTGEIGAILRRHGLYSSALCEWRRQREAGTLGGLTPVNADQNQPKPIRCQPNLHPPTAKMRSFAGASTAPRRSSNSKKNLPTCWGWNCRRSRHTSSPPTQPDRGTGLQAAGFGRDFGELCGTRHLARQPATQHTAPIARAQPRESPHEPAAHIAGRAAADRARSAPFCAFCRSRAGGNLCDVARRRHLSLLDQHDVSHSY